MGAVSNNNIGRVSLNQFRGLLSPLNYQEGGKLGANKVSRLQYTCDWALVLFKRAIFALTHLSIMTDAKLFHRFNTHVSQSNENTFHVELLNEFVSRNLALNSLTHDCRMLYRANIDRLKKKDDKESKEFCSQTESLLKSNFIPNKDEPSYEIFAQKFGKISWTSYVIGSILEGKTDGLPAAEAFKTSLTETFRLFMGDTIKRPAYIHFKDTEQNFNTYEKLKELLQEVKLRYLNHLKENPGKLDTIIKEGNSSPLIKQIMHFYPGNSSLTNDLLELILKEVQKRRDNIFKDEDIEQILEGCKLTENEIKEFSAEKQAGIESLLRLKFLYLTLILGQGTAAPTTGKIMNLIPEALREKITPFNADKITWFEEDDFNSFAEHQVYKYFKMSDLTNGDWSSPVTEISVIYECPSLSNRNVKPLIKCENIKFNEYLTDNILDMILPTALQ